ncbi:MAG TPA: hypothetical protein VHT52_24600 [Stellaceae bacterium]|jgi:hypothetical protein|nr:hypothetical protein [Stellaceae bacterium]
MPIQSDNPPDLMTLDQWKGLNQQGKRGSIDDQEEWWNENLFSIGPGNLRSCWGHGPAIYTTPGPPIRRIFFGFIGYPTPQFAAPPPGRFGWMFLDDGNVDQVDLDTHAVTRIGQIWNPIAPQYWADTVVWRPRFFGSQQGQNGGVLFGSPDPAQTGSTGPGGLYAWDGQTLSSPGDPAPDWLTDLQETDPEAPIPPMPIGLPGIYAMEVYQERLFVAGKDVISFSAPSNGADFSTTDGGGSFGYFGDKLTYSFMDLAASAGYLFVFGDSSTDLISNIQLTGTGQVGSPYTTNMNYANIDPQVGHRFPRPVGRIGRYFTMWNGAGIFMMQGGDASEIGEKTTNIFNTLDTSLYLPTMAPATMFGFRVLLCNGRFKDVFGVTRNLLLMWHPVKGQPFWSIASQNLELTNIGYFEQDSVITPYGTDGTSLYQLFAQPDPALKKILMTKHLRGTGRVQITIKNFKRLYAEIYDETVPSLGVSITGSVVSGGGGVPGGREDVGFQLTEGLEYDIIPAPLQGAGIWGGIDLQSFSPDFTLERIHLAVEERTLFGA